MAVAVAVVVVREALAPEPSSEKTHKEHAGKQTDGQPLSRRHVRHLVPSALGGRLKWFCEEDEPPSEDRDGRYKAADNDSERRGEGLADPLPARPAEAGRVAQLCARVDLASGAR